MDPLIASSLVLALSLGFLVLALLLTRSISERPQSSDAEANLRPLDITRESMAVMTLPSKRLRSFDFVTRLHPLDINLEPIAFWIWTPIFSLLFASSCYAAFERVDFTPAACVAAAEVLTGLWVPLFSWASTLSLVAAAAMLASAAASGAAAVFLIGAINPPVALAWHNILFVHVSFALFVGWLLCAATLSIGYALYAATGWVLTRPALLATAAVATALAIASRNPVAALPCAWACVWQRPFGGVEILGILICSAGVGLSLAM